MLSGAATVYFSGEFCWTVCAAVTLAIANFTKRSIALLAIGTLNFHGGGIPFAPLNQTSSYTFIGNITGGRSIPAAFILVLIQAYLDLLSTPYPRHGLVYGGDERGYYAKERIYAYCGEIVHEGVDKYARVACLGGGVGKKDGSAYYSA